MAGTIKAVYASEPNFTAGENFAGAVRYPISGYQVDAIGGEPTVGELAAYLIAAGIPGNPEMRFGCQLRASALDTVTLYRCNGAHIFINGINYSIPIAGAPLSSSGLSVDTLYYVYAKLGSVVELEASTTAPTADATYGHQIKTGDASRSYVGMIYPLDLGGNPTIYDDSTRRMVATHYNRVSKYVERTGGLLADRTTASSVIVELSTAERLKYLLHPAVDQGAVSFYFSVSVKSAAMGNIIGAQIYANGGGGVGQPILIHSPRANYAVNIAGRTGGVFNGGYNFISLGGRSSDSQLVTFNQSNSIFGAEFQI
jgi:hypothetical protein